MFLRPLISALSMGAIALGVIAPSAIAQSGSRSPNSRLPDGTLTMVMIDRAQLSNVQRTAFQRYLQTANLPPTKVGKRCQFYGKPDVWCLLLDQNVAQQVYNQLKRQREFGAAIEMKEVRRLAAPERT